MFFFLRGKQEEEEKNTLISLFLSLSLSLSLSVPIYSTQVNLQPALIYIAPMGANAQPQGSVLSSAFEGFFCSRRENEKAEGGEQSRGTRGEKENQKKSHSFFFSFYTKLDRRAGGALPRRRLSHGCVLSLMEGALFLSRECLALPARSSGSFGWSAPALPARSSSSFETLF